MNRLINFSLSRLILTTITPLKGDGDDGGGDDSGGDDGGGDDSGDFH